MKYSKASKWVKELQSHPDWSHCDIEWEAIDEIEEALSVVTPTKGILKPGKYCGENLYCPHCDYMLAHDYTKANEEEVYVPVCPVCGQQLKW